MRSPIGPSSATSAMQPAPPSRDPHFCTSATRTVTPSQRSTGELLLTPPEWDVQSRERSRPRRRVMRAGADELRMLGEQVGEIAAGFRAFCELFEARLVAIGDELEACEPRPQGSSGGRR